MNRGNLFIIVPAVVVAAFAAVALIAHAGGPGSGCGSFHFDQVAWARGSAAAQTGQLSPRWRTAEKLARCGTLDGRTKREVRDALGQPDSSSARRWLYTAGYELGDPRYLELHFGADGRVTGASGPD